MKTLLMHRETDFDLQQDVPGNFQTLIQDLELQTLWLAMADGNELVLDVAQKAILTGFQNDIGTILYRQEILKDCLKNSKVVRELYHLAVQGVERKSTHWFGFLTDDPNGILGNAIDRMNMFVSDLKVLRSVAENHSDQFESVGFTTLFSMLQEELSDVYLASIESHLAEMKFRKGMLVSVGLGQSNESTDFVLRMIGWKEPNWLKRLFGRVPLSFTVTIAERDHTGARTLWDLQNRGINQVANALAQSADHIRAFFSALRTELAFYVGCLNLYDKLAAKREQISFPEPTPAGERTHEFVDLYDVCLTLSMEHRVVSNTLNAKGKSLFIITGANQGGKSSFLRSMGLAQLMMQSGMFVGARAFRAGLCDALFTHYKREEDAAMKSGKLDEELVRMNEIVSCLAPHSMLLFNESFAMTNEREGSEIARQIVCALLEKGFRVFFVTHLYEFANGLFSRNMEATIFLRAQRNADGTRTFKLVEGEPLETSYGEDLYQEIFPVDRQRIAAEINQKSGGEFGEPPGS